MRNINREFAELANPYPPNPHRHMKGLPNEFHSMNFGDLGFMGAINTIPDPDFFTDFTECSTNTCSGFWTSSDTSDYFIDTTNDKMVCDGMIATNGMTGALGFTASDTAWLWRSHVKLISHALHANGNHHGWVLSDDTTIGTGFMYVGQMITGTVAQWYITGATSNFTAGSILYEPYANDDEWFMETIRNSATSETGNLSPNSDYSSPTHTTERTISSSIINLDTFKTNNRNFGGTGTAESDIFDISIWDGLTSL